MTWKPSRWMPSSEYTLPPLAGLSQFQALRVAPAFLTRTGHTTGERMVSLIPAESSSMSLLAC